jgi:hypothetical protein
MNETVQRLKPLTDYIKYFFSFINSVMGAGNMMPVINDDTNFVKHFSSDQNCTFSTDRRCA